jgi:hypothetical protein
MTVTDREPPIISDEELERAAEPAPPADPIDAPWSLSWPMRMALASLSLGAAGIHLVMVPSHADEWLPEGIAFALAGWFQVLAAVVVIARPSVRALRAVCAANIVFIAAWAWTRIAGAPWGPEAGVAQDGGFVDLTCVALEAGLVVLAGVALLRPTLGDGLSRTWRTSLAVIPIGILVLATAAIASPSAADHGHGDAAANGGHGNDESAASTAGTPMDHDHASGAPGASGASDAAAHDAHKDAEIAFLFPDGDDRGWAEVGNGEEMDHGYAPDVPIDSLDPATRAEYQRQLNLTMDAVRAYPTVKDAEAAGYRRVGPFAPGLGAHYVGGGAYDMDGVMSDEEIRRPGGIVYSGTKPESVIVGFMYTSVAFQDGKAPEGFAGPNDHWHSHSGICLKQGVNGTDALGADGSISAEDCAAKGGSFMKDITSSLLHVWTVPSYTSPTGVFSHVNPTISCDDGTYHYEEGSACTKK